MHNRNSGTDYYLSKLGKPPSTWDNEVKGVGCPFCKAEARKSCINQNGKSRYFSHISREIEFEKTTL